MKRYLASVIGGAILGATLVAVATKSVPKVAKAIGDMMSK